MNAPDLLARLVAGGQTDQDDPAREQILDAAESLFLDFGIRRTTIGQIARRANIGRPTLYKRFADKDVLVQALCMRDSRRLIRDVAKAVSAISPPEEQLVQAFIIAAQQVNQHPLLRRLLDTEPELILPYMTINAGPFVDIGHGLLAPILKSLQAKGHFQKLDIDYLLEALARLFVSIISTPTSRLNSDDPDGVELLARGVLRPLLGSSGE